MGDNTLHIRMLFSTFKYISLVLVMGFSKFVGSTGIFFAAILKICQHS